MAQYDTEAEVSTAIGVFVVGMAMGVVVAVIRLTWALVVWTISASRGRPQPKLFQWAIGGSLVVLLLAIVVGSGGLVLAGAFGLVVALLANSASMGHDKQALPEEVTIEQLLVERWRDTDAS